MPHFKQVESLLREVAKSWSWFAVALLSELRKQGGCSPSLDPCFVRQPRLAAADPFETSPSRGKASRADLSERRRRFGAHPGRLGQLHQSGAGFIMQMGHRLNFNANRALFTKLQVIAFTYQPVTFITNSRAKGNLP